MEALNAAQSELETLQWPIEPQDPLYRNRPIKDGFAWDNLVSELVDHLGGEKTQFYLVVFRSTRRPEDDNGALIEALDAAAYEEAKTRRPDALLHYFAGDVDEYGQAMSWCLWTDQDSAREALGGPAHTRAMRAALGLDSEDGQGLYAQYNVKTYDLRLQEDRTVAFETAA